MADLSSFLYHNLWLTIGFIILIVIYLLFELSQKKHQAKSLTPQDAIQHTSRGKGIFLDIRGEKAYSSGHIIGAIQTTFDNLKQGVRFLQKYKNKPIVVYCHTGQSSKSSYELLKQQGFEDVSILRGGFSQWKNDNLPIEKKPLINSQQKTKKLKQVNQQNLKRDKKMSTNINKPIEIYYKDSCPFCIKAKALFEAKGVTFKGYDIAKNPELRDEMIQRTSGKTTVPEIFINDQLIGGCDELLALDQQGKLDTLLKPYLT